MGVRRFGRVNWLGFRTLATREVMRFMAVWQQTIFAPLMTAALFVLVFALALGRGELGVDHPDQRGLPRAVAPDQREPVARADVQVDIVLVRAA
ncbi:MAG: hypothetical protein ABGW82_09970, partial [Paracoccus sp. (in: a-proteobacteria)]